MSIYCSRVTLGLDYWAGKKPRRNGRVVTYPNNRLALVDADNWPQGNVDTASIPAWCVPGHEEEYDGEAISEWMRLSVSSAGSHLSVLIDQKAARLLVKDLRSWLKYPKVTSAPEDAA